MGGDAKGGPSERARYEIARSVARGRGEKLPPLAQMKPQAIIDYLQNNAPPVYDPFSGGGSIPLEAQRLGLRAMGSDLNPVAVLIGKALIEFPPKFAGRKPVNPDVNELHQWKARRASLTMCATTAAGCAPRPRRRSAISIPR